MFPIIQIPANVSSQLLRRLEELKFSDVENIFNEIPEPEISEPAQLFALKMLEINRNRLLEL